MAVRRVRLEQTRRSSSPFPGKESDWLACESTAFPGLLLGDIAPCVGLLLGRHSDGACGTKPLAPPQNSSIAACRTIRLLCKFDTRATAASGMASDARLAVYCLCRMLSQR